MWAEPDRPRVLVAPDKLRGTATSRQAAAALAAGVADAGGAADVCPVSDGGEGFLDALGGPTRTTTVTGPLGSPVVAPWRLAHGVAVIETALASGLQLVAHPGPREAEAATSSGTGELVAAALAAGARRVLVGLGGSASSDGGRGALAALAEHAPFAPDVDVVVACDVRTPYLDAARVFGPQKGADDDAVARLTVRLEEQAAVLAERFGRDVRTVAGSGAAGGIAGALHAAGARLESGFGIVAEACRLDARLAGSDLVLTAEGRVDPTTRAGKAIAGLVERAAAAGVPVTVIGGAVADGFDWPEVELVDLTARYGEVAARTRTAECLRAAARTAVERFPAPSG